MNLHHQSLVNGTGQPCARTLATFVCEGSVVAPHRPLYFTPEQARKGCPRRCLCEMVHKDHGVQLVSG